MKNNKEKILVIGDIHGKFKFFTEYIEESIKKHGRFKYIIQLGDFGFWPHFSKCSINFPILKEYFDKIKIPLLWVDGNHEDHSILQKVEVFEKSIWNRFGKYVFYKKRGSYIELKDKVFLFIGGAKSIDKHLRTETVNWFKEEEATREQSHEILKSLIEIKNIKKDIIVFTHSMPYENGMKYFFCLEKKEASWQNKFLFEILKELKPEKWFHGHYHVDMDYKIDKFETKFFSVDLVDKNTFGHRILEI